MISKGIRNRLVIELFYTTGMRRAELISLEESNVLTISQKHFRLLDKQTKERILPLLECTVTFA